MRTISAANGAHKTRNRLGRRDESACKSFKILCMDEVILSWSRFEYRFALAHRDRGPRCGVDRCIKASSFSTTIDLCLSVFPWVPFRSTKAAVKLHTPHSVDRATGLICDQTVILSGYYSHKGFPVPLRRIKYVDPKTHKRLVFLTNQFGLPALSIADLPHPLRANALCANRHRPKSV
jgi:hypothetical protein